MRLEPEKCATFDGMSCDVFAFLVGLVFIHVKYFRNRQVEIVCPVSSILQSVVFICIFVSVALIVWHKKICTVLKQRKFFIQSQIQQRNLKVSSRKLLAYILDRKWLHYFDQSIVWIFYGIDNISDCILWFVERFILIKSFVNICNGIHECFFFHRGPSLSHCQVKTE